MTPWIGLELICLVPELQSSVDHVQEVRIWCGARMTVIIDESCTASRKRNDSQWMPEVAETGIRSKPEFAKQTIQ